MTGLDLAIVAAYIAGIVTLGVIVSRRIGSFRDYFVAGGRMTTPLLLCTLVSTYYGLDVLFGASEVSYQEGLVSWFVYLRPYYVAILVAALVIARRLRRYDFLSLPDIGAHFFGRGTQAVLAVASFLYALPILAIMGIGVVLDLTLGIPFAWGALRRLGRLHDPGRPPRRRLTDADLLRLTRRMVAAAAVVAVLLALFFQTIFSAWIFMSTVLIAATLVPIACGLYLPRTATPTAGLAASLTGLTLAVAHYALVHLFGTLDPAWATQIWTVRVAGAEIPIWQEYALLVALPGSAAAYVLGARFGRKEERR